MFFSFLSEIILAPSCDSQALPQPQLPPPLTQAATSTSPGSFQVVWGSSQGKAKGFRLPGAPSLAASLWITPRGSAGSALGHHLELRLCPHCNHQTGMGSRVTPHPFCLQHSPLCTPNSHPCTPRASLGTPCPILQAGGGSLQTKPCLNKGSPSRGAKPTKGQWK